MKFLMQKFSALQYALPLFKINRIQQTRVMVIWIILHRLGLVPIFIIRLEMSIRGKIQ